MNADDEYIKLFNQLESMKTVYEKDVSLLDFCQQCLSDSRLEYLPSEISVYHGKVMFNYEEGSVVNHLMITFDEELCTFESKGIDYYSLKSDSIISGTNLSWAEMCDLINEWHTSIA